MKKLLFKGVLFIVLLALTDVIIGSVINRLQEESQKVSTYRDKLKNNVEYVNSDVIIIGASDAAHHYDASAIRDSIGMSVHNCGMDGCFLSFQVCELHLMLQRYLPKIIIWQFGPEYLSDYFDDFYDYQGMERLYPYYNDEFVKQIIDKKKWYQKILMKSQLYKQNSQIHKILSGFLMDKHNVEREDGYNPLPDKGYDYPELSHEDNGGNLSPDKCALFENAIQFIQASGVDLIAVTAPMYNDFDVEAQDYYNEMIRILEKYNVPYINFRHHPYFMSDSTLYKDYGHLNERGAEEYMKLFIPQLKCVLNSK